MIFKCDFHAAGRRLFSKGDQLLYLRCDLCIVSLFDLVPGHTASAIRVSAALYRDFRPIIDTGTSGHCKEHCKLLEKEILISASLMDQSVCIVRIQKVEQNLCRLTHITHQILMDRLFQIQFCLFRLIPKLPDGCRKGIVHNGVKFVSAKPGHGIMPDFPQQIKIRF